MVTSACAGTASPATTSAARIVRVIVNLRKKSTFHSIGRLKLDLQPPALPTSKVRSHTDMLGGALMSARDLATLFRDFDRGRLSRRQLLTALGLAVAVRPAAAFAQSRCTGERANSPDCNTTPGKL